MNVGSLLHLNAQRYPDKPAIIYRGRQFTYRELNDRVNRLAHHLRDLGVQKGDRVGFMLFNSNQFAEIFFATQKIGALAVPMSFRLVPREVKWILDKARCKVFVYSEACANQVEPVKKEFSTVEHLIYSGSPSPPGEQSYETLVQEGSVKEPAIKVEFKDRARIQFTGGTTGSPKGAVHTHRSTIFTCIGTSIRFHISDPSEIQLNQVPMFHSTGLNLLVMSITAGGRFVIVETFDPLEILRLIEGEQATFLMLMPPATYIRLLDIPQLKDFNTTSVQKLITAAGTLSQPTVLRIFDTFPNASILYGWGLTETGPTGTINWITRTMAETEPEKLKSIGQEFPFAEVRVVDEQGQEVPVGEVGEGIIRAPSIMEGYFEQPALTAQAIQDGWVYTGDLIKKDEQGFFYFADRKKDMIKSGGENVYAQEVERVILSHPAVENCAVIGIPDPTFYEAVMAVIKLRPGTVATAEEIMEHCKKDLSSYKKPRQVAFVESFPLDSVGKIQKFKLREQFGKRDEGSKV